MRSCSPARTTRRLSWVAFYDGFAKSRRKWQPVTVLQAIARFLRLSCCFQGYITPHFHRIWGVTVFLSSMSWLFQAANPCKPVFARHRRRLFRGSSCKPVTTCLLRSENACPRRGGTTGRAHIPRINAHQGWKMRLRSKRLPLSSKGSRNLRFRSPAFAARKRALRARGRRPRAQAPKRVRPRKGSGGRSLPRGRDRKSQ